MIDFEPELRVWNLLGRRSFYALRVDPDGRVVHLGFGPRPAGMQEDGRVVSGTLPEDVLPAAGLDRQGRRDELLGFGDTTYQEVALKVAFPRASPGPGESAHLPVRDVRLRYAGQRISRDAVPGGAPSHGRPTRSDAPRETLVIELEDPVQPLRARLCYRLTPEHDVIERWVELENTGPDPIEVEQLYSASVHLPPGAFELTHASGGWAAEFATERHPLPSGLFAIESRSVQTGFVHSPFFLLCHAGTAVEEAGPVWFGQLAWSGSFRLAFERRPNGALSVHGGYNPFDFALSLAAGEVHVTPALAIGIADDGFGGASRRMHGWIRDRVLPRPQSATAAPAEVRPVLYNSWEASYFELSTASQLELARRAAAIGVELFCVDDGWFGGRRNDRAGLGDWQVSPDVFPDGLTPLIDAVRELGMQFGLWVEPEMVNADSELYRAHPDWVLHFPGRPRTEQRNQLLLDFGRPEVVEHLSKTLDALLDEHAIDFLKWDMNRSATEPGSPAGKAIWRAHAEGVYAIMDGLRRRHPALAIESCSSGGGRIDAGILARCEQVWTSDNTDALARVAIQEGYGLAFPAAAMACWVTHERNHQTGRRLPLRLRFHSAMRGVLGIGSDLAALAQEELDEYAAWIAFYKRFRHVVQGGHRYRLQALAEAGTSILEYVLPDASEAVVSCIAVERRMAELVRPARLFGLDPDATYVAHDRDGAEYARARGVELMAQGLDPNLGVGRYGPGYAATLHLTQT